MVKSVSEYQTLNLLGLFILSFVNINPVLSFSLHVGKKVKILLIVSLLKEMKNTVWDAVPKDINNTY